MENKAYDIIIVGAGPAGLTAAIYARRANRTVLLIEKGAFGGQMTFSPKVENYPGFEQISGNELADHMTSQALYQGVAVETAEVLGLKGAQDGSYTVMTDYGDYTARAVILALGVKHRLPGIAGEEKYLGNGISFCAVCDGAFYRGKEVAVLGGGNSAVQEAVLLSENCKKVTVIQDLAQLTADAALVKALRERENVYVLCGRKLLGYTGEAGFSGVVLADGAGKKEELSCDGLFVAIGLIPCNDAFAAVAPLDGRGYFAADESCTGSANGIFVAGDCRAKKIRQIATAVGDGAVAAQAACAYLNAKGRD